MHRRHNRRRHYGRRHRGFLGTFLYTLWEFDHVLRIVTVVKARHR